jgi:hypothetical protein
MTFVVFYRRDSRIRRVFVPYFFHVFVRLGGPRQLEIFSLVFSLRITIHAIGHCARAAKFKPIRCKKGHCFTPPRPVDCDLN